MQNSCNFFVIPDLISAIENMKSALTKGRLTIELTTTKVKNILGVLEYYTKEFAGANNYEYTEPQMAETDDTVSNLVHILKYSRRFIKLPDED